MSVLLNPEFVKYEDVVPCISHTTKTHKFKEITDPKTKEVRKSCDLYPSISCDVHDGMHPPLQHQYTPASFICGPDGEPLAKPDDAPKGWDRSVGALTKRLSEVQQKLGRPVPRALHDKIVRDCAQADKDLADGKLDKAVKAMRALAEDKKLPQALKDARVKPRLDALNQRGDELIEEAKGKRDASPDEALKLAKKVSADFKGIDAGKKAAELVKEWEAAKKS